MDRAQGQLVEGRYRIEETLGEGATGVVYRALDTRAGRPVALKVLHPRPDATLELSRRVRRAARLHHPHIVQLHDVGERSVAMELVDGVALEVLPTRLDAAGCRALAIAVAKGLAHAHAAGVLHRDLKPANILVPRLPGGDGWAPARAKISDFGLAGELDVATHQTLGGVVIGTPLYMSPEQVRGEALGPSSDLWALGVVLYEQLHDRRPFDGPSMVAVVKAVLEQDVDWSGTLPSPFARVLPRLLARDRSQRYGSADELLADLEREPAVGPGPADPVRDVARGPTAERPLPVQVGARANGRSPWAWGLVIGGALVAASAAVLLGSSARLDGAAPAVGALVVTLLVFAGLTTCSVLAWTRRPGHPPGLGQDLDATRDQVRSRAELSQSMAVAVNSILEQSKRHPMIDFAAASLALAVHDYQDAGDPDDRTRAMDRALALFAALDDQLARARRPWFERYAGALPWVSAAGALLAALGAVGWVEQLFQVGEEEAPPVVDCAEAPGAGAGRMEGSTPRCPGEEAAPSSGAPAAATSTR